MLTKTQIFLLDHNRMQKSRKNRAVAILEKFSSPTHVTHLKLGIIITADSTSRIKVKTKSQSTFTSSTLHLY